MSERTLRFVEKEGWLLLAVFAALFLNLGGIPLFDLDEGAFSAATWEMLQRGDFITTYLNGELRFDKPILIYWLQAASVSLFGVTEFAFRLPSALAASAWAYAVLAFARPRLGSQGAVAAAVITVTAVNVMVIGRAATADALLNLFITLTMLDVFRYIEQPRRAALLRIYAWMGLGVLTKGPVAVAIPMIVSLLYFASQRDLRPWLRAIFYFPGWALFLAVAAPWYVLEYRAQGQAFIDGFFLKHNVGRFSDTMEGHGGHWYYYLIAVPLIVLPYTGLLVRAVARLPRARVDRLDRWLWLWFGFVFLFFSLSSTQLPHYVLYGSTPLFLLFAKYREELRSPWLAYVPALAALAVLTLLPQIVTLAAERQRNAFLVAQLEYAVSVLDGGYVAAMLVALAAAVAFAVWARRMPWRGLLAIGVVQATALALVVAPAAAKVRQEPFKEAAAMVRALGEPVVMWGLGEHPSFIVYRGALTPQREPRPGELVLTRVNRLDRLAEHKLLYSRAGIVLARLPAESGAR